MVLNRMSQEKIPISKIHESLPQFHIIKDKIDLDKVDKDVVMNQVISIFKDAKIDKTDGLKLSWDDRWIHLRGSNTEPILRIYAEAPTKSDAHLLVDRIRTTI